MGSKTVGHDLALIDAQRGEVIGHKLTVSVGAESKIQISFIAFPTLYHTASLRIRPFAHHGFSLEQS